MTVINTNTAATLAANALTKNERAMSQAMERLSTGVRINSAGDDAAGLAISSRMTSQIRGLDQATRNANDAISMAQTADGAYIEVTNMLQRMREIAVQAASGTNGSDDRDALDTEYRALSDEIQRISGNTQWNGVTLLDDSAGSSGVITYHVGANANQTVTVDMGDLGTNNTTATNSDSGAVSTWTLGTVATGDVLTFKMDDSTYGSYTVAGADATNINGTGTTLAGTTTISDGSANYTLAATSTGGSMTFTRASGSAAITELTVTRGIHAGVAASGVDSTTLAGLAITAVDTALTAVNTARAAVGAGINRLEYTADNLANVSQNTSASRSRILDADYASETTELARTQIIQQAGTAMLSQANQQAQSVLALLK
jgi:flagellin